MREIIKRIALRLWPELGSKTYFPQLAVVVNIPDPPADGGQCAPERPRYAVDVRLLTPELTIDDDMPLLRDVPVALQGAAPERGFAALPLSGTIVELAFAFGRQSLPFVRSVLPDNLALPACDGLSQRWQHAKISYQEVDAAGNWTRTTPGDISDGAGGTIGQYAGDIRVEAQLAIAQQAAATWSAIAPQIWLGSQAENVPAILSEYMAAVTAALGTLAAHTHPEVGGMEQADAVNAQTEIITAQKARLDIITKPTPGGTTET